MKQMTTIGLDIARSVFQVHGVDGRDRVVLRQRLRRAKVLEPTCRPAWSAWRPAAVLITGHGS